MRGHLAVAKEQSVGVSGRGIEQRHRAEGNGQGPGEQSKYREGASREGARGRLQRG